MTEAEKAVERRRRQWKERDEQAPNPRPCCKTMAYQLEKKDIFDVLVNEPFTTRPAPPTVWAMSDGGHGGMVPLQFCPFCGARFIWERA